MYNNHANFVIRALEERKKEQQDNEEQIREEVLARRKQEQREATQRFQKDTVHKKKLKPQVNGTDKGVCSKYTGVKSNLNYLTKPLRE